MTDRPFHVIAKENASGVEDFAIFASEIKARRALDQLEGWKYVTLSPGESFGDLGLAVFRQRKAAEKAEAAS